MSAGNADKDGNDDEEEEHFYDVDDGEDDFEGNSKGKVKKGKKEKVPLKAVEKEEKGKTETNKSSLYDPFKRDAQYSNANRSCLWEIAALRQHYHPTIQKYATMILEDENNSLIEYKGYPLLDFSLANFLDRFAFKKAKKKESAGIKNLKGKNKMRRSKIEEPLSISEVEIIILFENRP